MNRISTKALGKLMAHVVGVRDITADIPPVLIEGRLVIVDPECESFLEGRMLVMGMYESAINILADCVPFCFNTHDLSICIKFDALTRGFVCAIEPSKNTSQPLWHNVADIQVNALGGSVSSG